jgi:hypothetical protein
MLIDPDGYAVSGDALVFLCKYNNINHTMIKGLIVCNITPATGHSPDHSAETGRGNAAQFSSATA